MRFLLILIFIGLAAFLAITSSLRIGPTDYLYPILSAVWEAGLGLILLSLIVQRMKSKLTQNIMKSFLLFTWALISIGTLVYFSYFSAFPGRFALLHLLDSSEDALDLIGSKTLSIFVPSIVISYFFALKMPIFRSKKLLIASSIYVTLATPVLFNAYRVRPGTQTPFADLVFTVINLNLSQDAKPPRLETRTIRPMEAKPQASAAFNTLIILNESFRADRLYSFRPNYEGVKSFNFPNAFSNASYTHLSVPSLLSGISPSLTFDNYLGAELIYESIKRRFEIETSIFSSQSYKNGNYAAFLGSPFLDKLIYRESENWKAYNNIGAKDSEVIRRFIQYLDTLPADKSFFSILHLSGTHYPYRTESNLENYDLAAKEVTAHWEQVLGSLYSKKFSKPTLTIIMSDHAEALGEYGFKGHFSPLIPSTVRVPLLFLVPDSLNFKFEDLDRNVSNLDLAPTLLEMYGIDSEKNLDGRGLFDTRAKPILLSNNVTGQDFKTFAVLEHNIFKSFKFESGRLYETSFDLKQESSEIRWGPSDCRNLGLVPSFAEMRCED